MSHVSNHMVFNSATSSLNKSLFKVRVYTSAVVEINFINYSGFSGEKCSTYIHVFGYSIKLFKKRTALKGLIMWL